MMTTTASILGQAGAGLGGFLPRLGGALALLILGLIIVRLLARVVIKLLQSAGIDDLADRGGVTSVLQQAGLGDSLAVVISRALRIALSIVVIFAALSLLGLQFLSDSLNKGIQELPKLIIAAALVLGGVVLAGFARERADRVGEQMDLPIPLGRVAQIAVLTIFGIVAAAQVAVSTLVLLLLVGILLAGVTGTFTLAFGLGGHDIARALSAGRYLRHDYRPGQEIGFGEIRGTITQIEPSSTTLDPGDGTKIRVPNHLLMETIVTIYSDPEPEPDAETV
jgi:small-conductance mechanosensitive channel